MPDESAIHKTQATSSINARQAQVQRLWQARQAEELEIVSDELVERAEDLAEFAQFNPLAMQKNAQELEKRLRRPESKGTTEAEDEDKEVHIIEGVAKIAQQFQERNPELNQRSLLNLKTIIHENDSPEEVLRKILKSYPDHFLADEALRFLEETTDADTKLGRNIRIAKELLNERYGREIKAGRNVNNDAVEFAKQGIGSPSSLRDLYRDVTGNPREAVDLFQELSEAFSFDKLKTVLQFMLHSIGSDLKSKGPSISSIELQRLMTEVRTMQAILGVYRFFYIRMALITSAFLREQITLPKQLTFELLAKQFVKLIAERYPSPDKILRLAAILGIGEEIVAQIIIFTQFRDALRGTSPRLFKSDKHRQDLLMTLIETISELDDLLEEEGEEEEEEKSEEEKEEK